ncbi:MAG: D-sedoheptulose 7-phosphate isomerase [Armatimonadota bacterium]
MLNEQVVNELKESANVKLKLAEEGAETIIEIANILVDALSKGHTVLFCGNGGSAADAQHLAAELLGKFKMERKALPAIALTVNTSALTAIGNDYSYDNIFERLVEAHGREGDVILGISTSGNSKNVVKAIVKAREIGMKTVAFCGFTPGAIGEKADICLTVPSKDTPRIQEAHITAGHIICGLVERKLFGDLKQ